MGRISRTIALGALFIGLLLACRRSTAMDEAAEVIDAAETVRAVREAEAWIDRAHSFRLKAVSTFRLTPEGVELRRREFEERNPGVEPDPGRFPDLRPVTTTAVDLAFEGDRLRYRTASEDQHEDLRLWDGRRFVGRTRSLQPEVNRVEYRLAAEPGSMIQTVFWTYLYAFRAGPRAERWYPPEDDETIHDSYGAPEDYVDSGLAEFRGIPCRRLSHFPSWTQLFVGVDDGRLRGTRIGAHHLPDMEQRILRAVNDLGHAFGSAEEAAAWQRSLDPEGRREMERSLARTMHEWIVPLWETVLGEYREVAPGCRLPMTQELVRFGVDDGGQVFETLRNDLKVVEVSVDADIPDDLFTVGLEEGARVWDETHDPPLHYEVKADRTPQEWAEIIAAAEQRAERDTRRAQAQAALDGTPAPEFPGGATWLNGTPLTWADLEGQYVVLDFWSEWCGPCRNDLAMLRGAGAKSARSGITYVGIHTAGSEPDAVRGVAGQFGLDFPICIDVPPTEGPSSWGLLFAAYAVDRIPHAVLVGPDGRVVASGELSEMVQRATERLKK